MQSPLPEFCVEMQASELILVPSAATTDKKKVTTLGKRKFAFV